MTRDELGAREMAERVLDVIDRLQPTDEGTPA